MIMIKRTIIFIIILTAANAAFSQEAILDENVAAYYETEKNFGQNRKHYIHFYLGTEFAAGPAENIKIRYGNSGSTILGVRYKRKILNFYAIGLDLNYHHTNFRIDEKNDTFLDLVIHSKERLVFDMAGLEFYNRINIGKRGNFIGNFVDLGLYTNYIIGARHVTIDKYNDDVQLHY